MVALTSRKEASAARKLYFFDGLPCDNGHIAKRYTKNGKCVTCERSTIHGFKQLARAKTTWALMRRELIRQPCERCGAKAEGHHEDYGKPMEITWLCPEHHRERHTEMRCLP